MDDECRTAWLHSQSSYRFTDRIRVWFCFFLFVLFFVFHLIFICGLIFDMRRINLVRLRIQCVCVSIGGDVRIIPLTRQFNELMCVIIWPICVFIHGFRVLSRRGSQPPNTETLSGVWTRFLFYIFSIQIIWIEWWIFEWSWRLTCTWNLERQWTFNQNNGSILCIFVCLLLLWFPLFLAVHAFRANEVSAFTFGELWKKP